MKKFLLSALAFVALLQPATLCGQKTAYRYPFRNPDLSVEQRIDNLLELLTPEEKIGMMMNSSQAVPRLGIPAYDWWNEALHGVARAGLATVFPQAIGMAAVWDDGEHRKTFEIISDEARAKYNEAVRQSNRGRYYGLTFWTPNINIFRDPRWGRGQETYGEDPFLTARLGVAAVLGLQGNDPNYFKTHACAKHYAVHSGPEWNRHSYDARPTERDLWETYLPAFRALIYEANVQEVMCAYNAIEGEPCCGNDRFLTDILRNKWGYDGMVVSDCGAIKDFHLPDHHGTHETPALASADAVLHGTDVECGSVYRNLTEALEKGRITEAQLDVSLRRILRGWFRLGMLDPADRVPWSDLPYSVVDSPEHRAQALNVARKSMTLLKNEGNVLPLSKRIKRIAVIGPNAADSIMQWGNYNGFPSSTVTILDGLRAKLPQAEITYERGRDLVVPWVRTSLHEHYGADGKRGMKVEFFNNNAWQGRPAATLVNAADAIGYNSSGGTALAQGVNPENTSTRISGRLTAPYSGEAVLTVRASDGYKLFVNGKEVLAKTGREASAPSEYALRTVKGKIYDIVLEQAQTGRRVSIDFAVVRKEPADFSALVKRIKNADAVIYVGGLSPKLEGEEMQVNAEGFRGGDRVSIDLPKIQRQMLADLRKTGKPVIFVLCTGSSLALEQDEKNYDALLCAWYGGQAGGTAVADVLFGDYNPAGRLPVTFYKSLEQLDGNLKETDEARRGFENYDMTGRTYRYMTEAPLYPFGHGLSYSSFEYGDAVLHAPKIGTGENLYVTVPVTNTSGIGGEEVVQVYVKRNDDPQAPVKSLRAFRRVYLEPGQTRQVELQIDPESFRFYEPGTDGLVAKAGEYTILYGGTSADSGLKSLRVTVE